MSNPKASVVITTYNRADYLGFAIESVLNQTFNDFELIIIDDGSTDNSADLVNSYSDSRIRYIYQDNQGQNPARNTGIRTSKGEYIALLDSDDIWLPEKLERQVDILDKHQDIGLVYCGTLVINEQNEIIDNKKITIHCGQVLDKLLMTNFLYNGSNPLFRAKCIYKVGFFDESFTRMTDWEFYLRFALYYKFWGLDEYLLLYRVHNQTMSHDFRSYEITGFEILDKIFSLPDISRDYEDKYRNKAYANRHRYLARRYFENNLMKEAREQIFKTAQLSIPVILEDNLASIFLLSYFPEKFISSLKSLKSSLKNKPDLVKNEIYKSKIKIS